MATFQPSSSSSKSWYSALKTMFGRGRQLRPPVRISWSFAGQTRTRLKPSGGSYLSSHDPREVIGIGPASKIDWVEITWPQPSGRVERLTNVPLDRYVRVVEGKGIQ
jgi:hypothetical protein